MSVDTNLHPIAEVARETGLSRTTIWRWATEGLITSERVKGPSRRLLVSLAEVREMLGTEPVEPKAAS